MAVRYFVSNGDLRSSCTAQRVADLGPRLHSRSLFQGRHAVAALLEELARLIDGDFLHQCVDVLHVLHIHRIDTRFTIRTGAIGNTATRTSIAVATY